MTIQDLMNDLLNFGSLADYNAEDALEIEGLTPDEATQLAFYIDIAGDAEIFLSNLEAKYGLE